MVQKNRRELSGEKRCVRGRFSRVVCAWSFFPGRVCVVVFPLRKKKWIPFSMKKELQTIANTPQPNHVVQVNQSIQDVLQGLLRRR